jgi:glycosyltransferase XagB
MALPVRPRQRLGEMLVEKGLITPQQLDEALDLQRRWGSRLGQVVISKGWVRSLDLAKVMAERLGYPFVNLLEEPADAELFHEEDVRTYCDMQFIPWRKRGETIWLATADPTFKLTQWAHQRYKTKIRLAFTSKFDVMWETQRLGEARLTANSLTALVEMDPEHSAHVVFTPIQMKTFYGILSAFFLMLAIWPIPTVIVINFLLGFILTLNFLLRVVMSWAGSDRSVDEKVTDEEVKAVRDEDMPVYSILIPMYKEPDVLPIIAHSLRSMDYPLSKLDIKLVLEAEDNETINAAKELKLESIFEIVRVPYSLPKTKPKACNYALHFSHGDFLTIYDAEDKPEPDQLKKAVIAFQKAPPNTACIQGRLNYFNSEENWLTRMFTLEYSMWFDLYLPALEALKIPIPLGGTSNHFRMDKLREVRAWDPYNVTEDADLGLRFTKKGYRVGVLNSTTFEEANNSIPNWIRQRSRWIKGYMQTFLVHTRHPIALYRKVGHVGFWGFQFFIGGTCLAALSFPILLFCYLIWLLTRSNFMDPIFPPIVLYMSMFNLLLGNGILVYLFMLGAFKRGLYTILPFALTVPFYWGMMSMSGYKALYQLINKPFFWEKTTHGLSKFTASEVERAKQAAA